MRFLQQCDSGCQSNVKNESSSINTNCGGLTLSFIILLSRGYTWSTVICAIATSASVFPKPSGEEQIRQQIHAGCYWLCKRVPRSVAPWNLSGPRLLPFGLFVCFFHGWIFEAWTLCLNCLRTCTDFLALGDWGQAFITHKQMDKHRRLIRHLIQTNALQVSQLKQLRLGPVTSPTLTPQISTVFSPSECLFGH